MKDILIDFGIPCLLIVGCFALLFTGRDGEVKSILLLAAGWVVKSGYARSSTIKK